MTCFTDLPSEIRQQILHNSLPETDDYYQPWADRFIALALINKQSLQDMKAISPYCSPIYRIFHPSYFAWPETRLYSPRCILPRPSGVVLTLFEGAHMDVLQADTWDSDCSKRSHWHTALLDKWRHRLPAIIPSNIKTVMVDATPMPGYIRRLGREWIPSVVDNIRVRESFLPRHQRAIRGLIQAISIACVGEVELVLTGVYSGFNRAWIEEIVATWGASPRPLQVQVEFVDPEYCPSIENTIVYVMKKLAPNQHEVGSKFDALRRAYYRLANTDWASATENLYAVCFYNNRNMTKLIVGSLAQFIADEQLELLDLPSCSAMHLKLVHYMATDLGIGTTNVTNDSFKHVRLVRREVAQAPPGP